VPVVNDSADLGKNRLRQHPYCHKFVDREEPTLKLSDREGAPTQAAWRDHRGHAGAIWKAGVEDRLLLRNVITKCAGDISNRDLKIPLFEVQARRLVQQASPLKEDATARIDHNLAHIRVLNQVRDRPKERQDQLKRHQMAPVAIASKYEISGLR
jgi:hypothetical protein